jgi:iron complex transport system permease protein
MYPQIKIHLSLLSLVIFIMAGIALFLGVYQFNDSILSIINNAISNKSAINESDFYVLFELRLPRIIMAILVGSGLAVAGTCLQGIFKNPLASPDLIGVTSGSILFAAVTIVLGGYIKNFVPEIIHYSLLSIMAFVGAMCSTVFVYKISSHQHKTNVTILLLAGVAISALCGAATGLLTYLSTEEELRNLTFWTLGSIASANWDKILILSVVILVSFFFLIRKGKTLNAMMLGEKDAEHLGINVEKTKKQIIIFSALLVGTIVAFSGTIGFVGLIVPYILRLIFKSNYVIILPLSAFLGAILVIVADTISRTVVAPSEIPIGILTSLMGAPVFISILMNYKKSL